MKKFLIPLIILMQIFAVTTVAQRRAAGIRKVPQKVAPQAPARIQFDKLADYVNDYNNRRTGERLLVYNVPEFTKVSYEKDYAMYSFQPGEDGDVGNTFFTSAALGKSLRLFLKEDAISIQVTCTLIEFAGEFDVYRSPFATKVEGLDENGAIIWTATGPEPVKLKLRQ